MCRDVSLLRLFQCEITFSYFIQQRLKSNLYEDVALLRLYINLLVAAGLLTPPSPQRNN